MTISHFIVLRCHINIVSLRIVFDKQHTPVGPTPARGRIYVGEGWVPSSLHLGHEFFSVGTNKKYVSHSVKLQLWQKGWPGEAKPSFSLNLYKNHLAVEADHLRL